MSASSASIPAPVAMPAATVPVATAPTATLAAAHAPIAVAVALGSNLEPRAARIQAACRLLGDAVSDLRRAPLYRSPALLPADAPAAWDLEFLNTVVVGWTLLPPLALLARLQAIEQALGRSRRGHWGPREIDLDLIAYGRLILRHRQLVLPHPGLAVRAFVARPLASLWPAWEHPQGLGTAATLAEHLDDPGLIRLPDTEQP